MSGQGDDGLLEGVVATAAVVGGSWFGGSWLAAAVFGGSWLRASLSDAVTAAKQLPRSWGDPASAWQEPFRGRLPGPGPYWASIVAGGLLLSVAWIGLSGLFRGMTRVGQRKRRRLGQVVRGRFAKRRELATLAVKPGSVTPGRFLVAESGRPVWQRFLDPRGPVWLATEWRAGTTLPPRWRWWKHWWFRRHQYNRGAVAIFGASQSGKTVTTIAGALGWTGPMIGSSVKADQVALLGPGRARGEGAASGIKVFDPVGSVDPHLLARFEVGSWAPTRPGMSFADAMKGGKALSSSVATEGGSSGNEKFFRDQAESLLVGLLWLVAQRDQAAIVEGVPPSGMRAVQRWVMGMTPWVEPHDAGAEMFGSTDPDLLREFEIARQFPWVDQMEWERARDSVEKVASPARQAAETRGGIYGSAQNMVWPWMNPDVEAAASDCDVTLEWLLGDDQTDEERRAAPRSLFISAPPSDAKRYAPVFAGCLNDLIEQVAVRYNRTGKPLDPPLLVLVDEAGNTPIEDLPEFASTVAAMGILLVVVYQSVAQVKSRYGERTGTLIANFLTKQLFAAQSDRETLELFADLLGEEEVRQLSATDSEGHDSNQTSTVMTAMTPMAKLRSMRVGDCVVIHGTLPPIWGRWVPWFRNRHFAAARDVIARFDAVRAVQSANATQRFAALDAVEAAATIVNE